MTPEDHVVPRRFTTGSWQTRLAILLSQTFPLGDDGSEARATPFPPLSTLQRRSWIDNLLAASVMGWRSDPGDPRMLWRDAHGEPVTIEHRGRRRNLCAHPYRFGINGLEDRVFNPASAAHPGDWDALAALLAQARALGIEVVATAAGYQARRGTACAAASFREAEPAHCACLALTRLIAQGVLQAPEPPLPPEDSPAQVH